MKAFAILKNGIPVSNRRSRQPRYYAREQDAKIALTFISKEDYHAAIRTCIHNIENKELNGKVDENGRSLWWQEYDRCREICTKEMPPIEEYRNQYEIKELT